MMYPLQHNAKSAIHENHGLTIGEQKNAIQNFYNPLLIEFRHMWVALTTCIMFNPLPGPGADRGGGPGGHAPLTLLKLVIKRWPAAAASNPSPYDDAESTTVLFYSIHPPPYTLLLAHDYSYMQHIHSHPIPLLLPPPIPVPQSPRSRRAGPIGPCPPWPVKRFMYLAPPLSLEFLYPLLHEYMDMHHTERTVR